MGVRPSRLIPSLAGLALAFALAACSAAPAATPTPAPATPSPAAVATPVPTEAPTATPTPVPAFPVTLSDDEGTAVTIPARPARIASLTPAATETLFALGAGDAIVARSEDPSPYPEQAASLPVVAKFDGVDIERIVSLKPDLVIAGGNFFTPADAIAKLRDVGIPVLVVYAPSVDAVSADIALLGKAVGASDAATAITDRIGAGFDAVQASVAALPAPRVFYELDATSAIYGPADRSFLAEMIRLAGGDPITSGSPDKYDIAAERLIAADPEVILLADAPFGVTADAVAKRPGWSVMTAVKGGEIRPIDDTLVTRPGPRIVQGLEQLASAIHPGAPVPSSSPIPPVPSAAGTAAP